MNFHYIAIGLSLSLLACSNNTSTPKSTTPEAAVAIADAAPSGPRISISISPSEIVAGETTTLTAEFSNFELVDPRNSPPPKPGEGHYHVYFNGSPNYTALWAPTEPITTTVTDPPPGEYSIRAVLVDSAHQNIMPLVEATATFTILAP